MPYFEEQRLREDMNALFAEFANEREDVFYLTSEEFRDSFEHSDIDWTKIHDPDHQEHYLSKDFYHTSKDSQWKIAAAVCKLIRSKLQWTQGTRLASDHQKEQRVIVFTDSSLKALQQDASHHSLCSGSDARIRFFVLQGGGLCLQNKGLLPMFGRKPQKLWKVLDPMNEKKRKRYAKVQKHKDILTRALFQTPLPDAAKDRLAAVHRKLSLQA